ncbi:MAG: ATP synthase F1 subunit gamma [Ignavibacteriaceae bacterium]|nr:ATP synthase F1 subunit gamma [Ignavibacteriaceae bacterium]
MPTLRDIRGRIRGVQSTQKITKAMKMVAAAKLRRAQDAIINARPYAKKISVTLGRLIGDEERENSIYLAEKENVENILLVVVTADRGLCGAFNTNIIKEATAYHKKMMKEEGKNVDLFCIGKKGYDFFRKRDFNVVGNAVGVFQGLNPDKSNQLADLIIKPYVEGKYDQIYFVYNEFKSVVSQKIISEDFLPITVRFNPEEKKYIDNYIYEPSRKKIVEYMLPKYLQNQVWRVLLESNAAEFGARMTAMDNATTNASDLMKSLRLTYNKARQAAITKEILEIVSGANALKKSGS